MMKIPRVGNPESNNPTRLVQLYISHRLCRDFILLSDEMTIEEIYEKYMPRGNEKSFLQLYFGYKM